MNPGPATAGALAGALQVPGADFIGAAGVPARGAVEPVVGGRERVLLVAAAGPGLGQVLLHGLGFDVEQRGGHAIPPHR